MRRNRLYRRGLDGRVLEYWEDRGATRPPILSLLEHFADKIENADGQSWDVPISHLQNVAFIQAAYDSAAKGTEMRPSAYLEAIGGQPNGQRPPSASGTAFGRGALRLVSGPAGSEGGGGPKGLVDSRGEAGTLRSV